MKARTLIITIALYTAIWFLSAHIIKKHTIATLEDIHDDNISFSYKKVSVSGFPLFWEVHFSAPRVTMVENNGFYELIGDKLIFKYGVYQIQAMLKGKVLLQSPQKQEHQQMFFDQDSVNKLYLEFNRPAFFITQDNWIKIIEKVHFSTGSAAIVNQGKNELGLKQLILDIVRHPSESADKFALKLKTNIGLDDKRLSSNMVLDLEYIAPFKTSSNNSIDQLRYEHFFKINELNYNYPDSNLSLQGQFGLKTGEDPNGKFNVKLTNHVQFIENFIPNELPTEFKKSIIDMVEESILSTGQLPGSEKVQFDIILSDQKLGINRKSL